MVLELTTQKPRVAHSTQPARHLTSGMICILEFQTHNAWLQFDLPQAGNSWTLCWGSSIFSGLKGSLKVGMLLSGIEVKPICNFPPIADIVWLVTNRPDFGWIRTLYSQKDYLFSFQGNNYVPCCPPKYLQVPQVCQLSSYCYTKVNTTFFRKHQLCDYFLQASGEEFVCWV